MSRVSKKVSHTNYLYFPSFCSPLSLRSWIGGDSLLQTDSQDNEIRAALFMNATLYLNKVCVMPEVNIAAIQYCISVARA